jgi:amino acid adenylation domain-containing protein
MDKLNVIKIGIAQEEILYDQLIQPTSTLYNTSQIYEIEGTVDAGIMDKSIQFLLTQNSIFNSCLVENNASFYWELNAFSNQYESNPQYLTNLDYESLLAWCKNDNQKLFDLEGKEALYKIIGIQLADRFIIYAKFHHIWMDANGLGIFIQKLSAIYNHYKNNVSDEPTVFLGDYKNFIKAQEEYLNSEQYTIDKAFWSEYLHSKADCLQESIGKLNTNTNQSNQSNIKFLTFSRKPFDALFQKLKDKKVNDFHYAIVVLYCTLRKVFQVKSLNLTCPNANRFTPEAKETIGHYSSIKPLLIDVDLEKSTPSSLIQQIKEDRWATHNHQQYPFSHINREFKANDVEMGNLSKVSFSYERQLYSFPFEEKLNNEFRIYPVNNNAAIRISFTNRHIDKDPRVWFMCKEDLFSPEEIAYFIKTFETLYFSLIDQLDINIEKVLKNTKILTEPEEQFLLTRFNSNTTKENNSKTIVDLFAAQVAKMPDHVALVHKGKTLSLSELHIKSNQLANYLLSKDLPAESIIGLLFEPSFEMIIGILGVLKAGFAYLPIDSDLPEIRKGYMLNDCNCTILLGKSGLEVPKDFSGAITLIDIENLDQYNKEKPNIQIHPDQLAYIIYTSGTTGQPKGAMLTHQNIANYTQWFVEEANISDSDKTILLASYAFDGSYTNIYSCFITGCTLFLASRDEVLNVDVMLDFVEMNEISFLKMTPTYFNTLFISPVAASKKLNSLKLIVMGGEAIRTEDVQSFNKQFSHTQIMNHYGPTETTVGSVFQMIDFEAFEVFKQYPTIGKPIANTQIYLLDEYSQLVPYGVEGEIYIGGDGLARGYLNREDLTKEKFIDHPYKPRERIYRTGDIGRWMPDGNLAYLGRKDEQVKIRGYRIELTEIESVLLKNEGVESCVVVANNKGKSQTELVAYTVGTATSDELCNYVKDILPTYMVPAHFVRLESIPFNSNGKVNKKVLPSTTSNKTKDFPHIPPITLTEKTLAKIWSEVLDIPLEIMHKNADLFELGGHSLKIITLISRLKTVFNIPINLSDVYANKKLEVLSILIDKMLADTLTNFEIEI